ncbi:MAG: hypothetical protein ACREMY_02640 [bacterium]
MASYHSLRIGVVATLLLVLLAVAGLPAQGQPVHPAVPKAVQVAGFGDRVWKLVVNLLHGFWQKEGTSIDPDGTRTGAVVNPNPPILPDEGTSIDPDGRN